MKRNLIILILIIIGFTSLILMGNIISIGDKLYELTQIRAVELGFYGVILIAFLWILLWPIIKIHATPEFPKLSVDNYIGDSDKTIKELKSFAKSLSNNLNYLPAEVRTEHKKQFLNKIENFYNADDLRTIIQKELNLRFDKVKSHINEWAKTVFMLTAVSQNGKLDSAISMIVNLRMISDLIECSGYRPTHRQLFNQYIRILATALFSYYLSNTIENYTKTAITEGNIIDGIDENSVMETDFLMSLTGLKLFSQIPGSLVDGALNSLLTLRIGYVTLAYLKEGAEGLAEKNGIKVRRHAMLESVKAFGVIAKETTNNGLSYMGEKIEEILKKKEPKNAN